MGPSLGLADICQQQVDDVDRMSRSRHRFLSLTPPSQHRLLDPFQLGPKKQRQ